MDIHTLRQQLRIKMIYDIPMRVAYYARVSLESDEQLNSLGNHYYRRDSVGKDGTKNSKWVCSEKSYWFQAYIWAI